MKLIYKYKQLLPSFFSHWREPYYFPTVMNYRKGCEFVWEDDDGDFSDRDPNKKDTEYESLSHLVYHRTVPHMMNFSLDFRWFIRDACESDMNGWWYYNDITEFGIMGSIDYYDHKLHANQT
jgi:hypothetical protein